MVFLGILLFYLLETYKLLFLCNLIEFIGSDLKIDDFLTNSSFPLTSLSSVGS